MKGFFIFPLYKFQLSFLLLYRRNANKQRQTTLFDAFATFYVVFFLFFIHSRCINHKKIISWKIYLLITEF